MIDGFLLKSISDQDQFSAFTRDLVQGSSKEELQDLLSYIKGLDKSDKTQHLIMSIVTITIVNEEIRRLLVSE